MAKKKVIKNTSKPDDIESFTKLKTTGRLTPEQYWKWRLTIEEGVVARGVLENANLKCQLKSLELEKGHLQLVLAKKQMQECQVLVEQSKQEYTKIKTEIEEDIGTTLNGCVISDVTFEVQALEAD